MDFMTGTRLAALRKENGYSQEALAEKLGISRQAISKWERSESSPDTDNLIALAALYSMSLDELLGMSAGEASAESSPKQTENSVCTTAESTAKTIEDKTENPLFLELEVPENKKKTCGKLPCKKKPQEKNARKKRPALYPKLAHSLLIFPFPILLGAAYVGLGYYTGKWHPLWLMMTLVPVYYWFAFACRAKTKRGFLMKLPVLLLTALVFLTAGILTGEWLKPLPLFLIVPIYYWFAAAYGKSRK